MQPMPSDRQPLGAETPTPDRVLNRIDKMLTYVALFGGGLTLVFLTALSVFNVLVMRKALNAPIKGAEDILVLALVLLVALAIPFGARTGAHIEIEVLEPAMPRAFARVSLLAMKVLGVITLAIMSWRLSNAGTNAAVFGESSQTLLISLAPFYHLLAVAIGVYCVILMLEIWQIVRTGSVRWLSLAGGGY